MIKNQSIPGLEISPELEKKEIKEELEACLEVRREIEDTKDQLKERVKQLSKKTDIKISRLNKVINSLYKDTRQSLQEDLNAFDKLKDILKGGK